jgi:hypothetical protein
VDLPEHNPAYMRFVKQYNTNVKYCLPKALITF